MTHTRTPRFRLRRWLALPVLVVALAAVPSTAHADFWSNLWDWEEAWMCGGAIVNCGFFGTECDHACVSWLLRGCHTGCAPGNPRDTGLGCEWWPSESTSAPCGYDDTLGRCFFCSGSPAVPIGFLGLAPDGDGPVLVEVEPSTFLGPVDEIVLRFAESMDPNFVTLGGSLGAEADPDYRWSRGQHFNSDLTLRPSSTWTPASVSTLTVAVRDESENETELELELRVRDAAYFALVKQRIDDKATRVGIASSIITAAPLVQVGTGFKKDFPGGLSVYYEDGASEAFEVHGAIHQVYLGEGGPFGPLGFPTSDETPTGPFGVNRFSSFECGVIWWLAIVNVTGVDLTPGCVP